MKKISLTLAAFLMLGAFFASTSARAEGAFLEITLKINDADRPAAAAVYKKYKAPFLNQVMGAKSKELLIRSEDVQVLHGFENAEQANAYLATSLFKNDVVGELGPLLKADPVIKVYSAL